jgi:tetratricopeptide (TPR) repeat protein
MAKQRRARSRPTRSKPTILRAATRQGPSRAPATPVQAEAPVVRAGYLEAVALYEQGLAAIQIHDYRRASVVLRSVLSGYPEEKELHERVRLYLNICDKHAGPVSAAPQNAEERIFAATLAFNAANYDEALEHLRAVTSESPGHDHAIYMLAVIEVMRADLESAVAHLLRAIELNPDNRALARRDPDLEPLRHHEAVRAALETHSGPKSDRRRSGRSRSR